MTGKLPVGERIKEVVKLFGFKEATIAKKEAPPVAAESVAETPGKVTRTQETVPGAKTVKPAVAGVGEAFIQELEDNKTSSNPKPTMVLYFDSESDFCLGALQAALNSKAASKAAKQTFLLLKVDVSAVKTNGLEKKLGVKGAQIVFSTPGGKVVARWSEPNMTAARFLDLLDGLAGKCIRESQKEAEAKAKAEKAAQKAAPKKDDTAGK